LARNFKFNRLFGLRWYQRFDPTFLRIFIAVLCITALSLNWIAQSDFHDLKAEAKQVFRERYIRFVAEFGMEGKPITTQDVQFNVVEETQRKSITSSRSTADSRASERKKLETAVANRGILSDRNQAGDVYSYLPEDNNEGEYLNALSSAALSEYRPSGRWQTLSTTGRRSSSNLDPGDFDKPMADVFNYSMERQGDLYIDITDELIQDPITMRGYRDPGEIEQVINDNQSMIEYCFRKELRNNSMLQGYVKVQFNISYEGYVLPESIKIVNSTLRNKQVEQCIIHYLRRLKTFKRLDESMGIARVIQKFVFN